MLQTMRFSIEDKADFVGYQSKFNKKEIAAIQDSAREAAYRINSNDDLNTARMLIGVENAAHEISESYIEGAYIIESSIEASTDRNVGSIEDLRALFDTRSTKIIWLLEQQRKELRSLLEKMYETMISPTETEAKEKTKWAINAYNKGLFDEAMKYFNISKELYPFDFIVYQFLGNIHLFERKEPKDALENYKLAIRHLTDSSKYYTSLAFLHIGLSHYDMGDYQDAYIAASNAIQVNPNFSEAYYRSAQYCSKLGRYDEALSNLSKAIDADRGYCLKALAEKDFEPMSNKLKDLIEDLTKKEQVKADKEIEKSKQLIKKFDYVNIPDSAQKELDEAIKLKDSGTYLNCRDAVYKAYASQKALVDSINNFLSSEIKNVEAYKNTIKAEYYQLEELSNAGKKGFIRFSALTLVFFVLGSMTEFDNPMAIIVIPILGIISLVGLAQYLSSMHKRASCVKKINSLDETKSEKHNIMVAVNSEKSKMNIDKLADALNYIEYEKYLRKTYG